MRGKWGCCGVSANEYSCTHGAQINIADLTPYLTYGRRVLDKKGLKGGKRCFRRRCTNIFLIKILCVGQNVFAFYFQRLSKVLAFINTGRNPGRDLLFVEHSEEGAKRMHARSPGSRFLGRITQINPTKKPAA